MFINVLFMVTCGSGKRKSTKAALSFLTLRLKGLHGQLNVL